MTNLLAYFPELMVPATLTQQSPGTRVNGEWIPGVDVDTSIYVIDPQPLTSDALQVLPDGEIGQDYRETWTTASITVTDEDSVADKITAKGITYKVFAVGDWVLPGGHRRVTLRRLKVNE